MTTKKMRMGRLTLGKSTRSTNWSSDLHSHNFRPPSVPQSHLKIFRWLSTIHENATSYSLFNRIQHFSSEAEVENSFHFIIKRGHVILPILRQTSKYRLYNFFLQHIILNFKPQLHEPRHYTLTYQNT